MPEIMWHMLTNLLFVSACTRWFVLIQGLTPWWGITFDCCSSMSVFVSDASFVVRFDIMADRGSTSLPLSEEDHVTYNSPCCHRWVSHIALCCRDTEYNLSARTKNTMPDKGIVYEKTSSRFQIEDRDPMSRGYNRWNLSTCLNQPPLHIVTHCPKIL